MTVSLGLVAKEAAILAGDHLMQALTNLPLDLRNYNIFIYLLRQSQDAQAPTLYSFDRFGHMIPTPGREMPVGPQERDWMDRFNQDVDIAARDRQKAVDDLLKDTLRETWQDIPQPRTIDPICRRYVDQAITWTQPRDPLILDLDGDGVELTASNASTLFDHNADGIKTGSQWAKSDDGILVRDLNGNGTIDSGRELFGDQTQISTVNAAGQTITTLAAHGFAALKALDKDAAGLSDGIFNASDVAYADLKVWRDLNQDGISQSNELLGLAESGVSAINLTQTATQVTQGKSTFTKTVSGIDANGNPVTPSTEQTVQNVNFTTNNFYRAFTDNPVVTAQAAALPQMQGAGLVRNLRGERVPLLCPLSQKSVTMKRGASYACYSGARSRFHHVRQCNLGLQVIDRPCKVLVGHKTGPLLSEIKLQIL